MSQQNLGYDTEPVPNAEQNEERGRIREEYRARLAEKLKDPEFRKIEGFFIGTDEAILALSDPPYYTACPNPFIAEWLAENAKPYDPNADDYHREPFAADVSEGKNDPIYNAHSYHTKVPHKAIMRYILHYTEPGDVVYDGFCGAGMTGVAAQMCGDKAQVESLGYKVCTDGSILDEEGKPFSKLGPRKAILNDLSPAATLMRAASGTSPIRTTKSTSRTCGARRCFACSATTPTRRGRSRSSARRPFWKASDTAGKRSSTGSSWRCVRRYRRKSSKRYKISS
jgi:hypothetical protein